MVKKLKDKEPTNLELLRAINRFANDTERRFQKIDTRFDGVDNRFGNIDKRFEKIEKRLEQMITRDEFLNHMDKIIRRLDDIEQENAFGYNWIKRLDSEVEKIKLHLKLA